MKVTKHVDGGVSLSFTAAERMLCSKEYNTAMHKMTYLALGGPFAVVNAILKTEDEWDEGSGPLGLNAVSFGKENLVRLWRCLLNSKAPMNLDACHEAGLSLKVKESV